MKAVVLTRYGGPEVLRITDVPEPLPGEGEVRVRVRAFALNFAEVLSRRGLYSWAPPLPYILGMEAFGEIDRLGPGVAERRLGEPVVVGTQFGTYAEAICVPAARALPPPRGLTPAESAAFPASYLTAWIGLMEMARLRPSDTLLVTAAAGGLGSAAIQIAKRFGARVIGAASPGKLHVVRSLGADLAIGYDEIPSHAGFNVVLETVGGDVYKAALRGLAPMGRIVVAGAAGAFPKGGRFLARLGALRHIPRASIFDMLRRSYGVMSFHVGWLLDAGAVDAAWADLVRFVEEHEIRPLVGRTFAFDDIAEAHRALESRETTGKVVIAVSTSC